MAMAMNEAQFIEPSRMAGRTGFKPRHQSLDISK